MNEAEMVQLMSDLDKGTNMFGPLSADVRVTSAGIGFDEIMMALEQTGRA